MNRAREIFRRDRARSLRRKPTPAEVAVWQLLKKKKMALKFRRQHPVRGYYLDFYCPLLKLAIEVDGPYHYTNEQKEKDSLRDNRLKSMGITILRLSNNTVLSNPKATLKLIRNTIDEIISYRPIT